MIKILKAQDFTPENRTNEKAGPPAGMTDVVADIIENVRTRGDAAVREYTGKFDGCKLTALELNWASMNKAIKRVNPELIRTMKRAAESIDSYHRNQIHTGFDLLPKDGVILGQKVTPLARVGCYVPGGTAPYPSSVLMNCIPAKIAGVGEIIVVTPPSAGEADDCNGVDPRILAAAKIAGVDRVFTIGGAQAVAALCYGTKTVPRVDKITGPGNAYVTEAKRQVYGLVGIDMLAGPSDILIIADKGAAPDIIAADMLAQCEHGTDSKAILITDSMTLAKKAGKEIKAQLEKLPRKEIAKRAIYDNSVIVVAAKLEDAFEISNDIAPEHLEILTDEPFNHLSKVINAGSVFLGKHTPVTVGDYIAGPNHVLPTSATARFSSPLTVGDFTKKTSYTYYSQEALDKRGGDAVLFAKQEGLDAHAIAVEKRLGRDKG